MLKNLNTLELKNFTFYWTPPKKYYDKDKEDSFFKTEYTFILHLGTPKHFGLIGGYSIDSGIAITANSQEIKKDVHIDYEVDNLEDLINTHYFFDIKQSEIPDNVKRPVFIYLFNEKGPFYRYINDLPSLEDK